MTEKKRKLRGHGEGSIFYRKDRQQWVAQIQLENGKTRQAYRKKREEAAKALQQMLHEQEQGTLATGPQQKLKDYLEYWFEDVHRPTLKLSSYITYQRLLKKHVLSTLGHIPLQKLTPQQVQSLYAQKLKEGLSARVLRSVHGLLHKALKHAVHTNLVSRNVCDFVTPPGPKRHEIQPITREQAHKLLKTARGHRLEALLTVALATGMRRGELLALRWQDIDFDTRSLHIRRTVNYMAGYGFIESEPKTAKSRRKIVLPPALIEVLREHRLHQQTLQQRAGEGWQGKGLVFCNTLGGFLDPSTLRKLFTALLEEAGLPYIRFHDLRHSAATILLTRGVHPKVVQELLGHSQISMTLDIYSHVLPSLQESVMEKLSDLLQQEEGRDEDTGTDQNGES